MKTNRKHYAVANILPIIICAVITFIEYVGETGILGVLLSLYTFIFVPLYLVLSNFLIDPKAFMGMKLWVIPIVITICYIIYVAPFEHDGLAVYALWIMFFISIIIAGVGIAILYYTSRRQRSE